MYSTLLDSSNTNFANVDSSRHVFNIPQNIITTIVPSEPRHIHFNMMFVKPSKIKKFPKHQIFCRSNILYVLSLL